MKKLLIGLVLLAGCSADKPDVTKVMDPQFVKSFANNVTADECYTFCQDHVGRCEDLAMAIDQLSIAINSCRQGLINF